MGVDITAYKQLQEQNCVCDEDGEPIDDVDYDWVKFYLNPDFPGRADDIKDETVYRYTDSEDMLSISYGGYNRLRNQLAELAGYPLGQYEQYGQMYDSYCCDCWNGKTGPFSEIINFSDCEGVIGTAISAKLAKDFADFQEKADLRGDSQFKKFYAGMRKGFEAASDGGAVKYS